MHSWDMKVLASRHRDPCFIDSDARDRQRPQFLFRFSERERNMEKHGIEYGSFAYESSSHLVVYLRQRWSISVCMTICML